jgi:hypothetical protein
MSDTLGYVIKNDLEPMPFKACYRTLGTARQVASGFNNESWRAGQYEVFEITGLKRIPSREQLAAINDVADAK